MSSTLDLALESGRDRDVCSLCHSLNEATGRDVRVSSYTRQVTAQSWPSAAELSGVVCLFVLILFSQEVCNFQRLSCLEKLYVVLCLKSCLNGD